jgi:hypothetical protein
VVGGRLRTNRLILFLLGALVLASAASRPLAAAPAHPAQNPVIWADVPDISVIRVGDNWYMSSTTMHMSPGVPIMKSNDLVHWNLVGYAYDRLVDNDALEDVGKVDLVFDVIGGDIQKRSAGLIRAGGTLVTIVAPAETRPVDGLAVDFVVESNRAQLGEIVQRVREGRLRTNIGNIATLDDAVAAFNPTRRISGKTIIRVRP